MLLVAPFLLPAMTAVLIMFFRTNRKVGRIINMVSSVLLLGMAVLLFVHVESNGVIAFTLGGWQSPFGITLVADLFSASMLLVSTFIFAAASLYSLAMMDPLRERYGYYALIQTLMLGINGSFLTGDLFNMFVWFEVMLISSFVLLALGGKKEQLEGAIKYVTINLIASTLFLTAIGITYGLAGSLNMADLSLKISQINQPGLINVVAVLFMVSFGIKSAIFPLFFWLPASYHTPPAAITVLLAGLLTKVGVYAIYRVFSLIFISDISFTHGTFMILAGFTMVIGVLGPIAQNDFRRILSFHIVSQVGYMILAIALYSPAAIAAGIFYILHNILAKTNLFIISGVVFRMKGSYELDKLGSVYKVYPLVGLIFLISAMALAGIPPFSGFWGKYLIAKAGFDLDEYWIIGIALFVGLLTLFSMTKIWNAVFWKDQKERDFEAEDAYTQLSLSKKAAIFAPSVIVAGGILVFSFFVEPIYELALRASNELLDKSAYIEAVLGRIK